MNIFIAYLNLLLGCNLSLSEKIGNRVPCFLYPSTFQFNTVNGENGEPNGHTISCVSQDGKITVEIEDSALEPNEHKGNAIAHVKARWKPNQETQFLQHRAVYGHNMSISHTWRDGYHEIQCYFYANLDLAKTQLKEITFGFHGELNLSHKLMMLIILRSWVASSEIVADSYRLTD